MSNKFSKVEYYKQSLELYLQYGYFKNSWNPKMAPYILMENEEGNYILDILKTYEFLEKASNLVLSMVQKNKTILFVGTTSKTKLLVKSCALKSESYYLNHKWYGGLFSNWTTTQENITKLKDLERLKEDRDKMKRMPKKEQSKLSRQISTLKRDYDGIKHMKTIPDLVIFANQNENIVGVYDTLNQGIPAISIIDSDSDPDLVMYPIPVNSTSVFSINFVLNFLTNKIIENRNKTILD